MPDETRGLFLAGIKAKRMQTTTQITSNYFSNAVHQTHYIIHLAEEVAKAPSPGGGIKKQALHHVHRIVKQLNRGE